MTRMIALDTYRGTGRPTGFSRVIESRDEARESEVCFLMHDGETQSEAHVRVFSNEVVTDCDGFEQWR